MGKFFSIYWVFIKQQIKSLIEYRFDFAMGMVGLTIYQIGSFVLLLLVFTQIKAIGDYTFEEILLLYGFSQIIRGIDHIYNDNMWSVAWNSVKDGRFILYLIRPINPITYIVMERVQFDGFGEILLGAILFCYAKAKLGLVFGWQGVVVLCFFILTGLLIYFAIKLLCVAAAFWTVSSGELMTMVYEVNSFTKYPLDFYQSGGLKFLLTYVLPFALVSYFPMVYFLRDKQFLSQILGFNLASKEVLVAFVGVVSLVFFLISLAIWRVGLRRYEPTGT